MVDISSFFLILVYILSSILLVVLIVLGIKLISVVTKFDKVMDELEFRLEKVYKMFNVVDNFTDSMALISDKIVDAIVFALKNIFTRKKGKGEDNNE